LTLGGILASVLAPIAMLWLCIATWQRRSDAHIYAQALREELRGLFFPTADQADLIGEDIRALMKQATEMSVSSRAAIKAIQRARGGLRSEIRDFAGVSQKAEFHIDRLADALGKRAEELLSLTETIEIQSEAISAKAQRGVGVWENVSAEITELGDDIDQIFTRGTDKLVGASDAALNRIQSIETSLSAAVENLSSRIGNVATQIDTTRDNLDEQADKLQLVSEAISGGAIRLEESLSGAEKISEAVEGVMSVMTTSLGKVEQTANTLFERTETIEKKLEERADILKDSADKLLGSTDSLQEVGDLATHKLAEALSMAISGAETITSAVRRSKDMMDQAVADAGAQIEQTSKVADEKLAALITEARINRDKLATLIEDIENKKQAVEQATKSVDISREEMVEAADKAVSDLHVAAEKMATRTEEPIKLIHSSVDRLEAHTRELDDRLSVRVVEVGQETSKLRSLVDDISVTLTASLHEITKTTEEVSAHSTVISGEVADQRTNLDAIVADMEDKTKIVSRLLGEQSLALNASLMDAESKISGLGQMFFDKGDSFIGSVNSSSEKIGGYEQYLSETLRSIDRKSTEVAELVSGQIDHITRLAETIEPETTRIIAQAERLESRYDDLKHSYLSATDTATACLIDLGDKLEVRMDKLGSETLETSKVFLMVTEDLTNALSDIKRVSEDAQDKMSQIQTGVKGRIDDLQLITDHVKVKVDSLQNNLNVYIKDLSEVAGRVVNDLEDVTDKFGHTTFVLDEKADIVTTKILDATRQYVEEGHRMSMMGEQAAHKSSRIISVIQEESEKLVNAAKSSLTELQKSGDTLSVRAKEIEEYLRASVNHAKTYGDELRGQAGLIATQSSAIVDQISTASSKLVARANEVRQAGSGVAEDIEVSRQKLGDESTRLGNVAKKTIDAADEAAIVFTKHSVALQKTIEEMVAQARQVRDGQIRTERESFLSAAKFVIESLYSLAIDVARHLEGDLDVRVLRAYQKGDVSAYARHLVEVAPKIPAERSQRKFIEDGEFRTYILRFIRQYEELLEQAQANDYSDLLSSVFSTSDIGRLYKILCEIAGRSSKEH
jgi:ABC-type transporter Mla subunit MlaD